MDYESTEQEFVAEMTYWVEVLGVGEAVVRWHDLSMIVSYMHVTGCVQRKSEGDCDNLGEVCWVYGSE